jgi:long-chain acyl-CoA synthetase
LPVTVIEQFEAVTGAKISEGYGLTEATSTVTGMPFEVHRPGFTGIPFPNMEVLIVDLETGAKPLLPREYGEVIVRGKSVADGYWHKPEETAAAFRDGWLYTGDIGYLDEEGILAIVDRKKDMILVSGFNVYPKEIDEVLHSHPGVLEAVTIGVPDQKRGEVPMSFVVRKSDPCLSAPELTEFLRSQLTSYKVPRIIQFIDELPRTKANKVDRNLLKKRYGEIPETE